jgi:DNA mismatch repair protein MutS
VARDIVQMKISLKKIIEIRIKLEKFSSPSIQALKNNLIEINELILKIEKCINENFISGIDTYGVINKGYDKELDEIKDILINGKTWMENFQSKERARTGINSLKVDFNKVFGYYIEITKANLEKAPSDYIRKQTLVNAERYITEELKVYEDKILNAEEKINSLENKIFLELRNTILEFTDPIQKNALLIATLDALISFAEVSEVYKYVMPDISESSKLDIREGRHPVIERLLPPGEKYIANDTSIDTENNQILIITGPNMSGKSSYLRQTGLIVLLAQIGCFVPARSASIGIVDKIFTRVGASDNISKGESTFLVEMHEAANILNNATEKSLILLDEIGRGTSTYDGISIAWAMTEYLHENPNVRAKTLFATHYHELNALADLYKRIKNFRVEVREFNDKVIFLRKITEGTADHSYGIQVAQMAGLPVSVTNRAKEILRSLEDKEYKRKNKDDFQISMFESAVTEFRDEALRKMMDEVDINNITPLEAINILKKIKDDLK